MRVITILTLSLVAGCGSGERVTNSTLPQAAGVPTPGLPAAASGAAAALQMHELDGVSVELVGVDTGAADTIQVRWRFLNHAAEERRLATTDDQPYPDYLLTADAFLFDDLHEKKYLVLVDENDLPIASRHGGPDGVVIGPGEQIDAWAKFPAPSTDTTLVSIHVPGAPPFTNIEIPQD